MKKFYLIVFIVGAYSTSYSQDYQQLYQYAKGLYSEQRYNLAMEAFKPLMVYDSSNPYLQYSSFYYALSAYHQNYPAVAKDMLLQIRKLYPEWAQTDEVDFWLSRIYFEEHQYFQALHVLQGGERNRFGDDGARMKQHFISDVDDVETLRMMLEEYPEDKLLAKILVKTILKKPFLLQDQSFLDSLIEKYSLEREKFVVEAQPVNEFKDSYKVAVLFPFLAKTLEPKVNQKRVNQFFLDMYQGMRLAQDTLRKEMITIDLLAYDTERDTAATKQILEKPEMKSVDLFIGPLFQNQVKYVQQFSMNNKINMINPVSGNSGFLSDNPYSLLFQPSYETIGTKSAELLYGRASNKNCVVFMGDTEKDSVTASNFIRKANELGLNITHVLPVKRDNAVKIFDYLATATEYDEFKMPTQFELKKDSIGSVFMASDDPLIYTKAISGLDTRGDSILLVGNESWLENQAINYETLERLHIMLAAPNFSSLSSERYKLFEKWYVQRHGELPNSYARMGFEVMWFVGHALHENGVYFQRGLSDAGAQPGFLTTGFNFSESRDNQLVPFVHFRKGELVLLDQK